jgi:hypothetical protein
MTPVSFTDQQMQQLRAAAAMLPSHLRDNFLRTISNRLADLPYRPINADLQSAITFALSNYGVAAGHSAFLCDSAPNNNRNKGD